LPYEITGCIVAFASSFFLVPLLLLLLVAAGGGGGRMLWWWWWGGWGGGQVAPPKAPTKDQIAAREYAALSPLARRKQDAETNKTKV
jgi:hypothetical protein